MAIVERLYQELITANTAISFVIEEADTTVHRALIDSSLPEPRELIKDSRDPITPYLDSCNPISRRVTASELFDFSQDFHVGEIQIENLKFRACAGLWQGDWPKEGISSDFERGKPGPLRIMSLSHGDSWWVFIEGIAQQKSEDTDMRCHNTDRLNPFEGKIWCPTVLTSGDPHHDSFPHLIEEKLRWDGSH